MTERYAATYILQVIIDFDADPATVAAPLSNDELIEIIRQILTDHLAERGIEAGVLANPWEPVEVEPNPPFA